ncbi:MAG: 4Fe-4S dicluster domain-containing protein [Deltaproteobacteria bacterium]|nr:4Fe-4S dicluster domain-containing protein [Deltaproteobacteria bacterium]
MLERTFTIKEWTEALKKLRSFYRVFAPFKEGDFHSFREFDGSGSPDFNFGNTRLSAKALIYPQSERMFDYTLDEKNPDVNLYKEAVKDLSPQAIVGIRPCDVKGFRLMKRNFDNEEYRDPWWVQRFESTILVGFGCNDPCPTCFCTSVGGGPFNEEGLDVIAYNLGERFVLRALTEKGEVFLAKAEGDTGPGEDERRKMEELKRSSVEKISSRVATDQLKLKEVNALFSAPFWEETAFSCINCGTCTFFCPTCWCFDIQDEVFGKEGDRLRNWDSCMFPLFTLHGSGHNPRENKVQRVRQRFMHKLKYYVDKYNDGVQCSGCGRCVRYCPVNIDIREVAEKMNSY